jgi:hypothetical protein
MSNVFGRDNVDFGNDSISAEHLCLPVFWLEIRVAPSTVEGNLEFIAELHIVSDIRAPDIEDIFVVFA